MVPYAEICKAPTSRPSLSWWGKFDLPRERVDQIEDEHVTMSVCSQQAYVTLVDHLEWIVRGTDEGGASLSGPSGGSLPGSMALPNERIDHPVSY